MRPGDRLILAVLAIIIVLTALDAATGGAIAGWANTHLAGGAQALGGWLMRIGLFVSPVLLLPLVTGNRLVVYPDPSVDVHTLLDDGEVEITGTRTREEKDAEVRQHGLTIQPTSSLPSTTIFDFTLDATQLKPMLNPHS